MFEDIILLIRDKNLLPELINEIHSWHADCEAGNAGECEIYDAIQKGVSDEELMKIAYDIDADLFEKYIWLAKKDFNKFEIVDANNPDEKISIKVVNAKDGLFIQPDNYCGDIQNAPLKIDYFDGKLSVMLWDPASIYKQSDPSMILELKGYTEADEKRFEYEEENGIF